MLSKLHENLVWRTLVGPESGGAAITALRRGYISENEWNELAGLRLSGEVEEWVVLRQLLACFVLLAEGHEL